MTGELNYLLIEKLTETKEMYAGDWFLRDAACKSEEVWK